MINVDNQHFASSTEARRARAPGGDRCIARPGHTGARATEPKSLRRRKTAHPRRPPTASRPPARPLPLTTCVLSSFEAEQQ